MKATLATSGTILAIALAALLVSRIESVSPTHAAEPIAAPPPAATNDWLTGGPEERFALISKQLRGFDVAMVETGYRYTELFWAGQDRNWGFAEYQVDKIRTAIEYGLERRPKRAASAQTFLTNALPAIKEAVLKKDPAVFKERFAALTTACNVCHALEKMPFVTVQPPEQRHSPVRFIAK